MGLQLYALCIDALDPAGLGRFWSGVLGRELVDDPRGGVTLLPNEATEFRTRFVPTDVPKTGRNQMHFDLTSSSLEEQQRTVKRALALGGQHYDVGQLPDEEHVVLADPEGNEFCVTEPGNNFLAGCGLIGALSSDGSQQCGHFWSKGLDWPLVWDQDEETAIQSPVGGSKISWGGPPLPPKTGKYRWHFDLMPDGDQLAEVERLVALGAQRVDIGQGDVPWIVMEDPDGHELCVLPPA
ncbi:MAG TPA: VOC family protein [Actinomycetales bacterium]|nr:VOC family protein [Actinomycetales bacterium]